MSEGYGGGGGEGGQQQQQQVVVDGCVAGGGGGCLPFYHVPQQCRREKLRYPNANDPPPPPLHPHTPTPSPPSLMHYNPTATTVSFMSPASSSSYHLLNPSSSAAAAYDHHGGVAAFNLLDPHALFGGDHHPQVQGVSLSLSSSVASSSHHTHHGHLLGAPPAALTGPLPLVPVAPRMGPVPAGPFTGYATILKGSRFLRPAQQLLEEVCGGGSGGSALGALAGSEAEAEPSDFAAEGVDDCDKIADGSISGEQRRLKTRLVSMLDEVYRRYKLYFQQIQVVITSFEAVAGLNMAAPYAPLALKSLAKHFKCLKHAISDQLRFTNEAFGKGSRGKDEISGCRFNMNGGFCFQRAGLSSGPVNQQPVWRPQRGLPERAVAVLRAWLFEHFLHPYPSDMDKQMLAKQTGLSRNQVSNWFINARVRLWKPMVEEIHSLELRQGRKGPETDNIRSTNKQPELSSASVFSSASERTPTTASPQRNQVLPHKRFHNELARMTSHIQEPVNFSLDDLPSHHRVGVPMGVTNGGNGGVSLTLGLHQNNGICLSEPLPLNVVRRFGLEESNVAYVMGGFEGQERQFGKEFDGQLLRDFVA
ncbi:hypothetical protein Taro_047077 [Colocasia esculenta]|uniref:Homeobox domain-containing protein n=1 Tax=Colocasia esculenta TaxID=4460 RepID=A0A843WU90_COLES|nr:hypothetical protein [Colocasia esculenta]